MGSTPTSRSWRGRDLHRRHELQGRADKAIKWLAELGNPYQINLYDPDGMLGLDLGVYGAPETFFIDSQGIIPLSPRGDVNPEVWASTLKPIFDAMK